LDEVAGLDRNEVAGYRPSIFNALEAQRRRPAMEHIAIDLGGKESQICVRDETGAILEERRCPTPELDEFLTHRPPGRVILETCAEAFRVADVARAAGHDPRVVAATLVRVLGVGARRTKYDRRDARVLSEVSCRVELPSVHIPTPAARERKSMCGMRETLVRARTQLANCLHGWLRTQGIRIPTSNVVSLPARIRAHTPPRPAYVERQLEMLDALNIRIREANTELRRLAKQDPVCRRLMTAPGVGTTTALRYVATLDEVGRFPDAHQVASYLGLVPGERSSGETQRRTGITKAGSPALRHCLVQAAWAAKRTRVQGELQRWGTRIERRRGKQVAAVAMARKLSGILYALWRDGATFDPDRAAHQLPPRRPRL
jgi:transposase